MNVGGNICYLILSVIQTIAVYSNLLVIIAVIFVPRHAVVNSIGQIAMTPLSVVCHDVVPKEHTITHDQSLALRAQLQNFYDVVLKSAREQYPFTVGYMGTELTCGLQDNFVDCVVENCKFIFTVEDLEEKCLICSEIFDIIDECICNN